MLTDATLQTEVIIACDANAIPADKRQAWVATGQQVYAAVQEVRELPDGFGFRLPTDSAMLLKTAEYIANERLCCSFLNFTIQVAPNKGPLWLSLTGGPGVKEYMRSVFETNELLDESVAQAAGLRQLES